MEPRITSRYYIWQILKINDATDQSKEYIRNRFFFTGNMLKSTLNLKCLWDEKLELSSGQMYSRDRYKLKKKTGNHFSLKQ